MIAVVVEYDYKWFFHNISHIYGLNMIYEFIQNKIESVQSNTS